MMLQPALSTFPAAMAITTTSLVSAPSALCPPLVMSHLPAASGTITLALTGQCPQTTAPVQPCLLSTSAGPGAIASSLLSFLAPQISTVSTASSVGELLCQVSSSGVQNNASLSPSVGSDTERNCSGEDASTTGTMETPVGLDLSSGWKVVGLTSLMDTLPRQSPSLFATPTFVSAASAVTSASVCSSTSVSSAMDCDQWKIVGLTSLNPFVHAATSTVNSSSGCMHKAINSVVSAAPVVTVTSAGMHPECVVGPSTAASSAILTPSVVTSSSSIRLDLQNAGLDTVTNSLALNSSDWKITGITTLPIPPIPAVNPLARTSTSTVYSTRGCLSKGINMPATRTSESSQAAGNCGKPVVAPTPEESQWRVVGVTSLPSVLTGEQPSLVAPLVPGLSLPVPVSSVASVPSIHRHQPVLSDMMQKVPAASDLTTLAGDGGWKVVGVVPLPQGADVTVSDTEKKATCEEMQEPSAKTLNCELPPRPKTPPSVVVQTSGAQRKENKKIHPLSFLPNCSNQFRNAILKKNTVSTMLELKRAYQQKHRREGKLLVAAPSSLNLPTGNARLVTYSKLKREERSDDFTEETDDKVALSKHYRSQVACEVNPRMHAASSTVNSAGVCLLPGIKQEPNVGLGDTSAPLPNPIMHAATSSVYSTGGCMHKGVHPKLEQATDDKLPPQESWQLFKAERGDILMSDSGSSSDGVNLTAVDPWGVCTDDDMDDVADMMADGSENKSVLSSSRKRKLSTPRKMVQ